MAEWVLTGLFGLSVLSLLEAILSLKGGIEFRRHFAAAATAPPADFAPPASLIVPCRGLDPGLADNLRAFFRQDYPDFQLLLVTDSEADPSAAVIRRLRSEHPQVESHLLFAGQAQERSQKVHNLLHTLTRLRDRDRVLAFGDSDIRPRPKWMRYLVGTLAAKEAGAATGFRWYIPLSRSRPSRMRAAWNAGAASLLREHDSPFVWGGAMALERQVFEACRVKEYWQNAVSDDYALSSALHDHGRSIHFQPHCLSPSWEDCSWRELLSWTLRQLTITRVYHPRLWALALAAQTVNVAGLWGGALVVIGGGLLNWPAPVDPPLWAGILATVYLLGCLKAWLRLSAVEKIFPDWRLQRPHLLFWGPVCALISLRGLLVAAWKKEIVWRGIRYRMASTRKTIVVKRA